MKIDELPLFKMPKDELAYFSSPKGMVEKIKKTGCMVFSFALDYNKFFDAAYEIDLFKKHFGCIGEIAEAPSCLPDTIRLNLKVSNDVWDAMEMFTLRELKAELKKYAPHKNFISTKNDMSYIFLCMSRKFKAISLLYENVDGQWLIIDPDIAKNNSFRTSSFGYVIHDYFTGYWDKSKQWFPKNWRRSKKESFVWLDHEKSPLFQSEWYSPLTFSYHGHFCIDIPIASSYDDIALIQPFFELSALIRDVQKAQAYLDQATKQLEDAQDSVEKVLVQYELRSR